MYEWLHCDYSFCRKRLAYVYANDLEGSKFFCDETCQKLKEEADKEATRREMERVAQRRADPRCHTHVKRILNGHHLTGTITIMYCLCDDPTNQEHIIGLPHGNAAPVVIYDKGFLGSKDVHNGQ